MAQAFNVRLRVDAILNPSTSSASVHAPLAALDTSPETPSSEHASPGSPEGAQNAASAERAGAAQKSGGGSEASGSDVKLDLAEISTSGSTSVFAGRAAPGASVTVFENGVAVASATANDNGDWSLATEHKFAGPDPKFSLRVGSFKIPDETPAQERTALGPTPSQSSNASASAVSRPASPSVALLQNFEKTVATARQEEAQSQPESPVVPAVGVVAPPVAPAISKPAAAVAVLSPSPAVVKDSDHPQSASIPVPMTFVFDQATLTPDGEKTAKLLLEFLQLKKFASVTLSGHADERGTADYNMDLSRKRLEAVSTFLRNGGYHGKLDLVPKGASEPFTGVDRSKFSEDDLMQLDRRVELRNAM
ncbi:MAG: OmpA family protein [Hyphomicrobium sp.]